MTVDRAIPRSLLVFFAALLLILFCRPLRAATLPFVLSYIASLPVRKAARKISDKTGLPLKAAAIIILLIFLVLTGFLLWLSVGALCDEILALCSRFADDPELIAGILRGARERIFGADGLLSFLDGALERVSMTNVTERLEGALSDAIMQLITGMGQKISLGAVSFAARLPSAMLFFLTFLLSCFYFSCDEDEIAGFFYSLLPDGARESLPRWRTGVKNVISAYITATLSLCGITLFICLCGLLCIGCRYAILMSLVIAIIDMLPLLGAGIILLPWSLVCFLGGDVKVGIALLVIWVIVTVTRQIVESKLLGKHIGLHPLATLMSVYVGAKLLGFVGLVAGPLIAVGIKAILPIIAGKSAK